ncbi:MAG: hypothetical protein WAN11_13430 [Syntrophobacteraceae bacterium]
MTRTKIAATLIILAAGVLGVHLTSARAVQANNWIYWGNQLIEVDFDDGTSIQYGYDENGNRISKTFGAGNQFYTISASEGPGGTISPSSLSGTESVISGGSCTFTAMPDTGYYVANVVVDGNSMGAVTGYTFTNVTASHTISFSFASAFPITAFVNGNGTITPAYADVNSGGSQPFTITANTGYYIAEVAVDGNPVGAPNSYTFTNVTEPHTIQASFAIDTYTITTSATGSGTIDPPSDTVDYGGSQTFAIQPVQGTYIVDVQVDGVSQGPVASYTFTDVIANHVLSATFSLNGPVKIVRTNLCYQHLQDAYNAAQNLDAILIQNIDLTESFTANSNSSISVTIEGGYTADFSSNPGTTTITGEVTISSGTVTMGNCVISN